MYYLLIILSVIMFGGNFVLNDVYRKQRGSSVRISLQFNLVSSIAGFIVLVLLNGCKFEFTGFTFLMAVLSALNGFGFTLCGFKALNHINLSLYSLFSMLGGMLLPFAQGIIFFNESITVAKITCFVLVTSALLLTVKKGEHKKGFIFYVGIFTLNGVSGVLSKIFTSAPYPKASAAGYSILISVCSIVLSALILLVFFRKNNGEKPYTTASLTVSSFGGVLNKVANYILVIALAHVDASVQYPMVTGGVIIVSTLVSFFGDKKPSKNELLSVAVAFIGLLALFIMPT